MKGRLKDLTFGRDGEQNITVSVRSDFRDEYDELKDCDIEVTIKKYRKRRSKDANAYCWVLIGKLSEKTGEPSDKIYIETIKHIGVYRDFVDIPVEDARALEVAWRHLGIGWPTEQVDYSPGGDKVTIRCYYGSSQYNTKQMSRLIDMLVQECKDQGIPTDTPDEIENLKSLWASQPRKEM